MSHSFEIIYNSQLLLQLYGILRSFASYTRPHVSRMYVCQRQRDCKSAVLEVRLMTILYRPDANLVCCHKFVPNDVSDIFALSDAA